MALSTEPEHDTLSKTRDEAPPGGDDEKNGQMVELDDSYTEEEERAVLRKIDCTILPMVCSDDACLVGEDNN